LSRRVNYRLPKATPASIIKKPGCRFSSRLTRRSHLDCRAIGAFWTQSARSYLRALILWVAKTEPPASSHLLRVRELLMQSKDERATLFAQMKASDIPIIARMGAAMEGRAYNEAGSILSACEAQTTFLEGEGIRRVLSGSSFQFADLKKKRVTVYLCLPATRLATHGRWLRLMVSMAFEAMERTGPKDPEKPAVLFCLDEFAALGRMENVERAAGQIASFGVKLWPVVQDLTQLVRDYREAWETFMGNAGCLTFWGNTDITTSEHVAKRLGELEVIRTVQNASETWARSEQGAVTDTVSALLSGAGPQQSQSGVNKGGNISLSQSNQRTPLLHGFEIVQAFARETGKILVIIPGKPPIALFRCVHHSEEDQGLFGGLYDPVPGQKPPRINRAQRQGRDA
jgi:type IV secretion system protein VirD4